MQRPTLTAPMKRMLLQFADGAPIDRISENGAGWTMTWNALRERNLITHSPSGDGKFVISEEGKAEASRIHASNTRKDRTT